MKTCISWTKVSTNVIFHDNEEVLLFQIYDFQMTWCDLYSHKMFVYFEDEIDNHCHDKRRQAFSKIWLWHHQLLTLLNRKLTRTPSFCSHKNLSLVFFTFLSVLLFVDVFEVFWNIVYMYCVFSHSSLAISSNSSRLGQIQTSSTLERCGKREKKDPKAYRGLQVGGTLCKILIIIIINRMSCWYEQQLTDQQQGVVQQTEFTPTSPSEYSIHVSPTRWRLRSLSFSSTSVRPLITS